MDDPSPPNKQESVDGYLKKLVRFETRQNMYLVIKQPSLIAKFPVCEKSRFPTTTHFFV